MIHYAENFKHKGHIKIMNFRAQACFDAVVRKFVKAGYTLISQVAISSAETPYHVMVSAARSTTLVFHKRGWQLFFILELNEYTGLTIGGLPPEGDKSYWTLKVHANRGEWADIFPLIEIPDAPLFAEHEERYRKIPFFESHIGIDGFHYYGSSGYQQIDTREAMPTETLAANVLKFLSAFEPFLAKGVFPELLVLFHPHYTFERCEELFWSRFDVSYLRSLVRRPYGALPFERRKKFELA